MQRFDVQHLWVSGEDDYVRYRIPALAVTETGTLLAFCEARKYTGRDSDQIDLLVRRSFDHGKSFDAPQLVATQLDWVCGNPAPVVDSGTGTVWLLFCKNRRDGDERMICQGRAPRTVWLTSSHDDGATWVQPVEITEQVKQPDWTWYATGPGHGLQLASGRLVIPCDHIVAEHHEANDPYHSHVIYSDDHGATWHIGGSADEGTNESTAVETEDGWLCLNCRNKGTMRSAGGGQHRAIAWSGDGGETFAPIVRDVALPEPICQASILRHPGGDGRQRVLFSNPAATDARRRMTVRLSYDGCRSWPVARVVHDGAAAYSDLGVAGDGMICCLFEAGSGSDTYQRLSLARFNLEWLTRGADCAGAAAG